MHNYKTLTTILLAIIFFTTAGTAYAETERRYINDVSQLSNEKMLFQLDSMITGAAIETRVAFPDWKSSSKSKVSLIWGYVDDATTYYSLSITHGHTDLSDSFDKPFIEMIVSRHVGTDTETLLTRKITDGIAGGPNYNSIAVELLPDGQTDIYAGSKHLELVTSLNTDHPTSGSLGIKADGKINVDEIIIEQTPSPLRDVATTWTPESIKAHLLKKGTTDPIEGYWTYLDRDNDDRYARIGGRYRIAIIGNDDGTAYDIIYMSGGEVNASAWKPGMRKGTLTPTIFSNHYNLTWFDASFRKMQHDIHASVTQNAIIELSFPTLKTTIRLSKEPMDNE